MATIVAVRTGNWSNTSHVTGPWPGGSTPTTKPGVSDTVQTGECIVTIDEDVHVALLQATSTGYFQVTSAPALPAVRSIAANVLNSETAWGALIISNPTGLVVLTGDVAGGTGDNAVCIHNTGTIGDITGNVIGGTGKDAGGIYNGTTIGDITGNVIGGAGLNAPGITLDGGVIGNVTGNVIGGAGINSPGFNNGGGVIGDIKGNVTDVGAQDSYGIWNVGTIGDIDGVIVCGPTGRFPIFGPFKLVASVASAVTLISSTDTPLTLSNDYPTEADVKFGVEYNRGTMTGELAAGNIGPVSIVIGGGGIRIS